MMASPPVQKRHVKVVKETGFAVDENTQCRKLLGRACLARELVE